MSPAKTAFERRMEAHTAAAGTNAAKAIGSWLSFTLGTDTSPKAFGKLPHIVLNWLTIAALAAAWWFTPAGTARWVVAGFTVAALIYSMGRAARHLSGRPKTLAALFESTRVSCKHPRGTTSRPTNPRNHITITRWATPTQPHTGIVTFDPTAPAASLTGRGLVERDIEKVAAPKDGALVFEWDDAQSRVMFLTVPTDDPRVEQRRTRRAIDAALVAVFPKIGADFNAESDWGQDPTRRAPETITVAYGAAVHPDAKIRQTVERGFDDRVKIGAEWVYDWSVPGVLTILGAAPDSGAAARKRAERKILDGTVAILSSVGGRNAAAQADARVTQWFPDESAGANTPLEVTAYFGTADFSDVARQHRFADQIDQMLEQEWADRSWIPAWQFGHAGAITLTAVPRNHPEALRKLETTKIRRFVFDGFPKTPGLDVKVMEWVSSPSGEQRVAQMDVLYGTGNVTDRMKQIAFETHLDSQTRGNDWRYEWDAAPGVLQITSVPPLPDRDMFPLPGTAEYDEWHRKFRNGVVWLGKAKGNYDTEVKFDISPHVIIGGSTGAGKSVALGLFLYGALMNPDVYELIVIDPKVTDFTWTGGYPNVLTYQPTDIRKGPQQIKEAVTLAFNAMSERQALLQKYGLRNLGLLRRAIKEGRITDMRLEDVPKRLLVLFDEGGAAFTPPKGDEDGLAAVNEARTLLTKIVLLSRATEIQVCMAAQKPAADNIGTAIRDQLVNKIGIGRLNTNTSIQVMDSNICATRLSDGAPKGRGWFVNDQGQELLFQTPYLPNDDEPCPWEPSVQLRGIKEQVADMLTGNGWIEVHGKQMMHRPKNPGTPDDGETVSYEVATTNWVRADRVDA